MKWFATGLLIAWAAVPAAAQQPASATIRGRVIDPQRRGVTARVRVVQARTGLQRETESDADGNFALTSIPPDQVDLIVTAPAHCPG